MILSDIYLWLSYSHVSTSKINRLLETASPERLWESFDGEGKYSLDEKTFSLLKRTHSEEYIERAKEYLAINHIEYVTRADPIYPTLLSQSEVCPPPVIYYKGDISIARDLCVGVVGTRNCTRYGKYATEKIAGELAEAGVVIVSGLATGIDGFAHSAALDAGGKTIAVLGSGLFNASPASNLRLFDEICKCGLVLTEYTPDVHASMYTFPQRNRIISGLCRGVLVVEAANKSGSLITANCALDQGRDVFAVPGDIDKPGSVGTNDLIKHGAMAVTCAADILDYYEMSNVVRKKKKAETLNLDFAEQRILDILSEGECSFDGLIEKSGMTAAELNPVVSTLVLYGLIHERAKNIYVADSENTK